MRRIICSAIFMLSLHAISILGQSTSESYYIEAIEFYKNSQFAKAIESCNKAVAIDPVGHGEWESGILGVSSCGRRAGPHRIEHRPAAIAKAAVLSSPAPWRSSRPGPCPRA
jgi:hypothetical protein